MADPLAEAVKVVVHAFPAINETVLRRILQAAQPHMPARQIGTLELDLGAEGARQELTRRFPDVDYQLLREAARAAAVAAFKSAGFTVAGEGE